MSAYVYEIGTRPATRSSAARRSRERRALTERQRQSSEPQGPHDPKRKLITLALVVIPLATASLSLAAALLGLFPAAPKPIAAPMPAPHAVTVRQDARSPIFASYYGSAHLRIAAVNQGEARSSASGAQRERHREHASQPVWTATLSVHVHIRSGVYGTTATFAGRISATGPKGSR